MSTWGELFNVGATKHSQASKGDTNCYLFKSLNTVVHFFGEPFWKPPNPVLGTSQDSPIRDMRPWFSGAFAVSQTNLGSKCGKHTQTTQDNDMDWNGQDRQKKYLRFWVCIIGLGTSPCCPGISCIEVWRQENEVFSSCCLIQYQPLVQLHH